MCLRSTHASAPRWTSPQSYLIVPALLVGFALTGCDLISTEPGAALPVMATVEGSIEAEYTGTGAFQVLPPSLSTPMRFSLSSRGVGTSDGQSFHFQGREKPAEGQYAIQELKQDPHTGQFLLGELSEGTYSASYSYRKGDILRIFSATSGAIQVTDARTDATPRHIAGTFQLTGVLTRICTVVPGFPGDLLDCEPAKEEAAVEITGYFRAGPLGSDAPGLARYP